MFDIATVNTPFSYFTTAFRMALTTLIPYVLKHTTSLDTVSAIYLNPSN